MPDPAAANSTPFLPRRAVRWLVGIVALACAPTCLVLVDETEFVLVQRFGRVVAVYDRPEDKGPHFKLPWPIDSTLRFDRRLRLFTPAGRELFTRDRKNLLVEAYISWRIPEPTVEEEIDQGKRPVLQFYRSLGRPDIAESRLASRLQSILTSRIGQMELSDLIATEDSEQGPGDHAPLSRLAQSLRRELMQQTGESSTLREQLGIEIIDVRIKRLNLPSGNLQAVYERMRSERQKIAERYRSAGLAESRAIRSQAERQATELLAQAHAEAERIKGKGEADALRILNEAHAADPEFYELLQSIEAYKQLLGDQTTLILSASSKMWKLLNEGPPSAQTPANAPGQPPESTP